MDTFNRLFITVQHAVSPPPRKFDFSLSSFKLHFLVCIFLGSFLIVVVWAVLHIDPWGLIGVLLAINIPMDAFIFFLDRIKVLPKSETNVGRSTELVKKKLNEIWTATLAFSCRWHRVKHETPCLVPSQARVSVSNFVQYSVTWLEAGKVRREMSWVHSWMFSLSCRSFFFYSLDMLHY